MAELDLGDDHFLNFTRWDPDLALNPQWAHLADLTKSTPHYGAIVRHKANTETGWCEGSITFDTELTRQMKTPHPFWKVESWEPLTCSPSLLCGCGDHGFIRGGKWVRA